MWSLGVCLYCFLCGRLPFIAVLGGPPIEELVQSTEPLTSEHLQPIHYDLLNRLLVKQPLQRATLSEIKEHAWVTDEGRLPIGAQTIVRQEVTEDEVRNSIAKLVNFRTVMRVYQAIRKFRSRTHSDGGQTPPSLTTSTESLNGVMSPPTDDASKAGPDLAATAAALALHAEHLADAAGSVHSTPDSASSSEHSSPPATASSAATTPTIAIVDVDAAAATAAAVPAAAPSSTWVAYTAADTARGPADEASANAASH